MGNSAYELAVLNYTPIGVKGTVCPWCYALRLPTANRRGAICGICPREQAPGYKLPWLFGCPTRVCSSRDNTFLQMIDRFAPICLENHPLISLSEDISLSERMLFVDFLSFAHKGIPRTIPNALLIQFIIYYNLNPNSFSILSAS